MNFKDLFGIYLYAYGLKKAGDSEAASSLVSSARGKGAPEQYAVALGLRDASDDEYTVGDDEDEDGETPSSSIFHFSGFMAAMQLAFDAFDTE